ncbi:MAG: gliding motility-associated C-terminal domain-containing protein [Flavobacteriales bacterium]|nr:gliding motility-associated C-terminal domain-containing protein [Flavobacteriales bacterium]
MGNQAYAGHIIGGDIYWECIGGQFKFYLTLYRDCSTGTAIDPNGHNLEIWNDTTYITTVSLDLISQTDISPSECGITCAGASSGDVATEQFIFASNPISLGAVVPSPNGLTITYHRCCRNPVDNLVDANNAEIYYRATMYPYNGQDLSTCYDSSPQFAELPLALMCSGYQLRYNSNATDADVDSLTYNLAPALGAYASLISYAPGYSPTAPLPGPSPVSLDPVTGQMNYDSPNNTQGRWNLVTEVHAWRCGQRISSTMREMSVSIIACSGANNIPQVSSPNWMAPAGNTGYEVTVLAGDLVNFTLTGTDNDMTGGNAQTLSFSAVGSQFGTNFTNANAGCTNPPCATLSNVTPPATGNGSISTTFNWQTDCNHVANQGECATYSSTYNFIFRFQDDFCPAKGVNMVNVAVTVVGEPIIPSPKLHCVSTESNGDITLYWQTVTDNNVPPSFVEYVIFHSQSLAGPYQEIGTVSNISTNTYTHTSGNPVAAPSTSGPNFYHVRTRSGCNDAVLEAAVDTLSSIYLTMTDMGATAELDWTPLAVPLLPSSNGLGYAVYQEYPAGSGAWTQIGLTAGTHWTVPVIWCNEDVNFRIDLTDNLTCTSMSNVDGGTLNNPAQPAPQAIDSLTVDPVTGFVTVCWSPNPSTNVVQYNVLLNPDAFAWVPMDTVYGYNNTCWTDTVSDPSAQPLWYQVYATNNCGIPGVPAGSIANNTDHHETMFLTTKYDSCEISTDLNWTRYWYWAEGVKEYEVYTSEENGPFVKIGTTTDTLFTHDGLHETANYCYIVRAVKNVANRITSTSNKSCILAYVPKRPEYSYNYNTTVQPGNTGIEEYFFVDSTAGYLGFEIHRGKFPDALNNLWFIPFDRTMRYYEYTDAGARPSFYDYYYIIIGVDNCNQYADTLNMSHTMHLTAEAFADRTNDLEWNAYEGWRGDVAAYNIYRSYDGVFEYLTTVPPTQLTYTDSIREIIIGEGNFCYYIEAVEGIGDPVGPVVSPPEPVQFLEKSRSNEACAHQHPNVFMPNAFMPEGVNNVFKPVTVYVDASSYLFQVYNRWGGKVFETTDPDKGWNGENGGKKEPQGAYVYFVQFVSSKGETYSKSGSVTLIR